MTHSARGRGLAATLVLVSSLAVLPHARAQSTSTSAYVYVQVQGAAGAVYGYSASSSGQLSAIAGSPFKPGTQIVAGTATKFFTLGKTLLHSYGIGSDGAIEAQKGQVAVFEHFDSACGDPAGYIASGAVLDHSGKYIYVTLEDDGGPCAIYQSYKINSDGSFLFDGDTDLNWDGNGDSAGLPSILGNESFAYSSYGYLDSGPVTIGFRPESSGTLELMQFHETDPTLPDDYYVTGLPDSSPAADYVVLQLHPEGGGPTQFGSYKVDSEGNISTTSTSGDMPTTSFVNPNTSFSPSGNFFAAGGTIGSEGIEIYKFNGAAPLTLYKKLLTGTPIDWVAWDRSNHLYAISNHAGKLYVFTVTSTSVTQDSSTSIGSPFKMVVVSK